MSQYSVLIQWSEKDNAYIATVPELPGLSAFGSSLKQAVEELSVAKKAYLAVLKEDGEEIPEADVLKPFSGQTRLRLPKTLHASLANEAKREGISLNTYIVHLLSERNMVTQMSKSLDKLQSLIYRALLFTSPSETTAKSKAQLYSSSIIDKKAFEAHNESSKQN